MKYKITLLFLFFFGMFNAQNLVLNSSFEDFKECPNSLGDFHDNVTHWTCSNYGSTDYFNECSLDLGYLNYLGNQEPKTGNAYAGIYAFAPGSYREYIQTKLSSKLIKGTKYLLTFYISLSDCSSHSVKDFGVLFTSNKLDNKSKDFIHFKYLERDNIKYNYSIIKDENFYSNTQKWTKIFLEYKATGFENFITIGNFDTNRKIEISEVWSTAEREFAYYYIDDVSLIEKPSENNTQVIIKEKIEPVKTILKAQKTYTFKNVLFNFNKAELLNTSIEELDKLYFHLNENKNLNIEIYGHTDNVGLQKRNQELSTERAKSVSDYLIIKGLNPERIEWFGFGSLKPITTNDNEAHRAKNRRVAFKLIKKN